MSINNVSAISDALKYVGGQDIQTQKASIAQDIKSSVFSPATLIFGGIEGSSALKSSLNINSLKDLPSALKDEEKMSKLLESDFFTKSKKLSTSISYQADEAVKAATKAAKAGAENVEKKGLAKIFSTVGKPFKSIKTAISSGAAELGEKAGSIVINESGKKLAETGFAKALSKGGKILKGTGAKGMMIFEGVLDLFTEVAPAFKAGGAKSGVKQIGKSALKIAGSGGGWAAGSVIGGAIGGTVGSVFPGVGTAIGAGIGKFLGGMVGSALGSGVANKIAGKSEVEKIQEQQIDNAAVEVSADKASMDELRKLVSSQIQYEAENGTSDADTEIMAQYLNEGVFGTEDDQQDTHSSGSAAESADNSSFEQSVQTNPVSDDYWTVATQKIQNGDTSVYNISDDKLNSVFSASETISSEVSPNAAMPEEEKEEVINYFG